MKLYLKILLPILLAFGVAAGSNTFEPKSKKSSLGAFIELAKFDNGKYDVNYKLNGRRYETDISLSSKYGIYYSQMVTPFLHSYDKITYQYANIRYVDQNLDEGYALLEKNGIDSSDVKGRTDDHRLAYEWGAEFRLSLFNSMWNGKPLYDVLMVLNGGFITGYNFMNDTDYKGSFIWGYDYGLSFRFEMFDHAYITSGFDWYHNYSRSFRKHGDKSKDNAMMIDFTQSGRLLLNVGVLF